MEDLNKYAIDIMSLSDKAMKFADKLRKCIVDEIEDESIRMIPLTVLHLTMKSVKDKIGEIMYVVYESEEGTFGEKVVAQMEVEKKIVELKSYTDFIENQYNAWIEK